MIAPWSSVLSLFVAVGVVCGATITVKTPLGKIRGSESSIAQQFKGIPYAEPPVGPLRWNPPQSKKPWSDTLDAFSGAFVSHSVEFPRAMLCQPGSDVGMWDLPCATDGPGCMQDCQLPPHTCPPTISEDCLSLNVFRPKDAEEGDKRPVMMFIHGGNFKQGYGGGPLYDGSHLANASGVIVVTINYRLGSLGFLATGGDTIRGSYGLMDQQEAMRWIRANIGAFGGDPSELTLFGQSAGAISVSAHMLMETSAPLFKRGVVQSNPFTLPLRDQSAFEALATALGKYANCSSDVGRSGLDQCLRNKTATEIIAAQTKAEVDFSASLQKILQVFLPWTPLVDPTGANASVPGQPRELFAQGLAQDKPLLIGTVENEALVFVFEGFGKPMPEWEYDLLLAAVFGWEPASKLQEKFPLPSDEKDDARRHLSSIATPALFACSTRNASLGFLTQGSAPVFMYRFDHAMSFGKEAWGSNFSICYDAVCHAGELPFLFDPNIAAFLNTTMTHEESILSEGMGSYWTNFAKTGDPNGQAPSLRRNSLRSYPVWPAFDASAETWMRLETPKDVAQQNNVTDLCNWFDANIGYSYW